MDIEVKIFGHLAPSLPHHQELNVPENAKVEDVTKILRLDSNLIGLITIDGRQSEDQNLVTPGCHLCFFPYLTGG